MSPLLGAPRAPRLAAVHARMLGLLPILAMAALPAYAADAPGDDEAYDPFLAFGIAPAAGASTAEAGAEKPKPYRDRIIAPGKLESLPIDEDAEQSLAGPPRSASVEIIASRSRFAGESSGEFGLSFGGFLETASWGAVSAEGLIISSDDSRNGDQSWRGRATLWQRGLQMPGGWLVNNGLGVLNTSLPALLRDQYRFILPSVPLLGLATEWTQQDRGLVWQFSAGQGGVFNGGLINGFETGDGSAASVGAQWNWDSQWSGAVSVLATDGRIVPASQGLPDFQNGRSQALVFGNRWRGARDDVSFTLQASGGDAGLATGAWLDARAQRGRWTHRYGGFYLEPQLAWGAWPINNDVRGGYYRVDFNRGRWSWNAGVDRIASISGNSFDGWYGSTFLRYQASARLAYGGSVSARESRAAQDPGAQAMQVFMDTRSRLGQTRAQFDVAQGAGASESWEITVDHALKMREGSRLSLSAGYGEIDDGNAGALPSLTLATYGGFTVANDISVDGTVRWRRQQGKEDSAGLDISLGIRWQISSRWSLSGNIYENRGPRLSPFVLDPLALPVPLGELPRDRTLYASLRYDFAAGRSQPVLGGRAGGAMGDVSGSVFLDENGDGQRAASELPARNVTVMLDNRYVVRTDEQGRYRFERVAVGQHTLSVVQDNLPLPWLFEGDSGRRVVAVSVRGETVTDFGARRSR